MDGPCEISPCGRNDRKVKMTENRYYTKVAVYSIWIIMRGMVKTIDKQIY